MIEISWPETRVGDLGEVFTGRTPSSIRPAYFGNEFPFITPGDMRQGKYARATERSLSNEGAALMQRIRLPADSVCVSCIGWQMGEVVMTDRISFTNQQINTIVPSSKVEPSFLYYSLRPRKQELLALGTMAGVRTPILNKSAFCSLTVQLPPLHIQRRIAGILSAYDDLIENSQRRIKILEEMARRLYREWFVYFRYPGHEGWRLVESPLGQIPEGWEVKPFSAIANYVNGYPFKPAELGPAGKPIVKIKELKAGIVADTPRNTGDNIPGKYHILDGDVLFSWSADLDAYLWMGGDGLLNQHLFTVLPADAFSRAFCFHSLKGSMPRFRALSLGATMHHIKRSALDQVFTVVAPAPMRKRFDVLVEPIHQQLITISKQIQNLRQSRDLLLPRLLSGQIDVEALPEPVLSES
jgi:type I restriction enzyme S subunit